MQCLQVYEILCLWDDIVVRRTGNLDLVFLFLGTDDFWRDYQAMQSAGIRFVREPEDKPYGTVAVFQDLYGNPWDLIETA